MPDLTIEDTRTGQRINPYLGGDPIAEVTPDPAKTEENKDAPVDPAAADPATPAASDAAPAAAKPEGEVPSDSVAQDEAADRDAKGRFIPKQRFDEVNERRKAAEKKLADREAADAAASKATEQKFDFDKAEREYMDLMLDGKLDDAGAKRREIRAAEQESFRIAARTEAATVNQQLTVKDRIEAISTQYETSYPAFNAESDQFSEDVVDDLRALYGGYLNTNKYPDAAAAFQAALDKTIQMHSLKKAEAAPAKPGSPATPSRTAQSRVEAIIKQPPMIAKTGAASPTQGDDGNLKPSQMTEREVLSLPEATRRRLRGDMI